MYLIYLMLIFLMLACGVFLLAFPFMKTRSVSSKHFLLSALFVIVFSLSFYYVSSDRLAVKQWLTEGKKHYQLQQEVERLGGFAGLVSRIKKKLDANPDDAEGWFILGKLYFADGDYALANEAFRKADLIRTPSPAATSAGSPRSLRRVRERG